MHDSRTAGIVSLLAMLLVAACQSGDTSSLDSDDANNGIREEVTDRYSDGSKKTASIYGEQESGEQLLRQVTYAKNGARVKVEYNQSGKVEQYEDSYQNHSASDYLRLFLENSVWLSSRGDRNTRVDVVYLFGRDKGVEAVETNQFETCGSHDLEYTGHRKIVAPSSDSERDTFKVELAGPNEISLGDSLSDEPLFLKRVHRQEVESSFLRDCITDFYNKN